jgi:hypothetical protein
MIFVMDDVMPTYPETSRYFLMLKKPAIIVIEGNTAKTTKKDNLNESLKTGESFFFNHNLFFHLSLFATSC